jgi:hypothetical protein
MANSACRRFAHIVRSMGTATRPPESDDSQVQLMLSHSLSEAAARIEEDDQLPGSVAASTAAAKSKGSSTVPDGANLTVNEFPPSQPLTTPRQGENEREL